MQNDLPNHDLIQLHQRTIGDAQVPTVSARQLHSFLEVGKDFSNWIKDRINAFGFAEGQDFVMVENEFSPNLAKTSGGRPTKEYFLAIDMAKELSMVERNDKGKQARRYFIECERRLVAGVAAPMTREQRIAEALLLTQELVAEQKEQLAQKDSQLAAIAPKAAAHDRIADAGGAINCTEAAKALQIPPSKLFEFLRTKGWLYRRAGGRHDLGYQDKVNSGLLTHKVRIIQLPDGTERITEQVLITPKGLAALAKALLPTTEKLAF